MKRYCKNDVALQYEVLEKILPFTKQTGDYVHINPDGITCPSPLCLSKHMTKAKSRMVRGGFKNQYQCGDCGSYFTDPKLYKQTR